MELTDQGVNDIESDYEEESASAKKSRATKSYYEEQDEIKLSLKAATRVASDNDEDADSLFNKKEKSSEERAKEEADYVEWLKVSAVWAFDFRTVFALYKEACVRLFMQRKIYELVHGVSIYELVVHFENSSLVRKQRRSCALAR